MRHCYLCDQLKALGEFAHGAWRCRECDRALAAKKYAAARATALAIYGGQCMECGSTDQLEFDHVDNDGGDHRAVESQPKMIRRIAKLGRPISDYHIRLLCRPCHRGPGRKGCGRGARRRPVKVRP